jgi:predicted nucleic acid-binding protein
MVVVIADAGPLIALAKINQLYLLPALFTNVSITQVVADECLRNQSSDTVLIKQALESGWLNCVDNLVFKHPLSRSLGLGEQSSIEYALQTGTKTLLILDDALARKQALRRELTIIGTAALLFAAQRKELIADAESLIAELNQVGYRISAAVIAQLKAGWYDHSLLGLLF